jgi:hypothetical protein
MSSKNASNRPETEGKLLLAISDYESGKFRSIRAAAKAYEVSYATLSRRLKGVAPQCESQLFNRKLTQTEENALVSRFWT